MHKCHAMKQRHLNDFTSINAQLALLLCADAAQPGWAILELLSCQIEVVQLQQMLLLLLLLVYVHHGVGCHDCLAQTAAMRPIQVVQLCSSVRCSCVRSFRRSRALSDCFRFQLAVWNREARQQHCAPLHIRCTCRYLPTFSPPAW